MYQTRPPGADEDFERLRQNPHFSSDRVVRYTTFRPQENEKRYLLSSGKLYNWTEDLFDREDSCCAAQGTRKPIYQMILDL